MDVLFRISQGFSDDEQLLSPKEKEALANQLNKLADITKIGIFPQSLYRTDKLQFPSNIDQKDSSMYLYNIDSNYVVILTYDYDVIFDQQIIGLYRVASKEYCEQAFNSIAKLLYEE